MITHHGKKPKKIVFNESVKMMSCLEDLIVIHKCIGLDLKSLVKLRQGRYKNKHDQ